MMSDCPEWVKGCLRDDVGMTTGVHQIADDLLQTPKSAESGQLLTNRCRREYRPLRDRLCGPRFRARPEWEGHEDFVVISSPTFRAGP
jgi:hypothetical protein